MTSYFEQLFKQMFIQRYSHINNVEGNIKGRPIKIASEYKKNIRQGGDRNDL